MANKMATDITAVEYRSMIRDMLDHENELINHRYDWLLTAQSILFGAIALAEGKKILLGLIICSIGIVSSFVTWRALFLADKSVENLISRWIDYADKNELKELFPPVYGLDAKYKFKFLPWKVMPPFLAVAWMIIASFYVILGH